MAWFMVWPGDMTFYIVWPGGHSRVYGTTLQARYGLVRMTSYMVWPGGHRMVYGIAWQASHGLWYGPSGPAHGIVYGVA